MIETTMNCESATSILNWLTEKVSATLGIDPASVKSSEPFAAYALGSVQSVSLVADLEDWLGQTLPATLLWDHPTLGDVASFLSRNPVHSESI